MPIKDESSLEGLLVLVIAFIVILLFVYINRALTQNQPNTPPTVSDLYSFIDSEYPWIPIGVHKGSVLYERTYSSGKKAWRYVSESGEYVYPHKKELNI